MAYLMLPRFGSGGGDCDRELCTVAALVWLIGQKCRTVCMLLYCAAFVCCAVVCQHSFVGL